VRYVALVFFLLASLLGCAATNVATVTADDFARADDERALWKTADEEKQKITRSGFLYADPALDAYLDTIPKKLLDPEVFERLPITIRVIKNYHLNAFALPNGTIYLHTGLLARMDNEAQLATLVAHEMTHSTHRHTLKKRRDLQSKSTFVAVLGSLTGGIGTIFGGLGAVASISGYSQELETEADTVGFELMTRAGYDPAEAPRLFSCLLREVEEEKIKEPFFFGTHPRLKERIENYEALIKKEGGHAGIRNEKEFRDMVRPVLLDNAALDLKAGRFTSGLSALRRYLEWTPDDARGHYLLGEAFRQRGEKGDLESAAEDYGKAAVLKPDFPEAYRGLSLVRRRLGDRLGARQAIETYLLLAPAAPDRAYMVEYLKELGGEEKK
jgi:predicted Zn-dependent protease